MVLSGADRKVIQSAKKILIIGDDGHGKNTVVDLLEQKGYKCKGTSEAMCEVVVFPVLKKKYHYRTAEECFEDRDSCREDWYRLIAQYCKDEPGRLLRELFSEFDVVHGCRSYVEFLDAKAQRVYDMVILVDASQRKPPKLTSSFRIPRSEAHYIIDNNVPKKRLPQDPVLECLLAKCA